MCILGKEAGPVLTIEAVEEKLEEPGPVPIEAVREELCLVLNAILVDPGCFCLRTRGDAPPLHPLPFGMLLVKKLLKLGFFFFVDKNFLSFPLVSATATEWEQMPMDFQLGHAESQLKSPFFFGVTK